MDKEEAQKKYLEFQKLNEQVKQIQESIVNLEQQIIELKKLEDSLNNIKKADLNEEILVLLGAGTYVKTKLADNNKVLMNIGSNTLTKKDINDSVNLVNSQIKEFTEVYNKMNEELKNNMLQLQELHNKLQKLIPK